MLLRKVQIRAAVLATTAAGAAKKVKPPLRAIEVTNFKVYLFLGPEKRCAMRAPQIYLHTGAERCLRATPARLARGARHANAQPASAMPFAFYATKLLVFTVMPTHAATPNITMPSRSAK